MNAIDPVEGQLHALVIGVGHYPNAAGTGVASLEGPAISAARFAEWLKDPEEGFRHPHVALGSVRTLVSPATDREAQVATSAAGTVDGGADSNTVKEELRDWADICDQSPADIGLLYVAGHGSDKPLSGAHLLLEGYSARSGLEETIDLSFIFEVMGSRQAHLNLFFVDACRTTSAAQRYLLGEQGLRPIKVGDAPVRRRAYKVFFGAAPDIQAWTLSDDEVLSDGTIFARALRRALTTAADLDGDGKLCVTANALTEEVARLVEEQAASYGEHVRGMADGLGTTRDVRFHYPRVVPVDVSIELTPAAYAKVARASLYRFVNVNQDELDRAVSFDSHPSQVRIEAGKYRLQLVSMPPPPPGFDMSDQKLILPHVNTWEVPIRYVR